MCNFKICQKHCNHTEILYRRSIVQDVKTCGHNGTRDIFKRNLEQYVLWKTMAISKMMDHLAECV